MTDHRIDLTALRDAATFESPAAPGQATMITRQDILLALIDAAEAARSLYDGLNAPRDPMDVDERAYRLAQALDRFDFTGRPGQVRK